MNDESKVYFCDNCMYTVLLKEETVCPNCGNAMEEIGFITKKQAGVGGSTKPGLCKCGEPRSKKGIDEQGRTRYRTQCNKCIYKQRQLPKKDACEKCGLKPASKKDLHKDHIDGDRSNNDMSNIQTLCAECHKEKTKVNEDWRRKNG